jgi:hypothetical protein
MIFAFFEEINKPARLRQSPGVGDGDGLVSSSIVAIDISYS